MRVITNEKKRHYKEMHIDSSTIYSPLDVRRFILMFVGGDKNLFK